jgi:hypothetical protein
MNYGQERIILKALYKDGLIRRDFDSGGRDPSA